MYIINSRNRMLYYYANGKTVKKMVDFHNQRRFTFRCIKTGVTPVSCSLKNAM